MRGGGGGGGEGGVGGRSISGRKAMALEERQSRYEVGGLFWWHCRFLRPIVPFLLHIIVYRLCFIFDMRARVLVQ